MRGLRTINVATRGWPPAHLDADGDWKPAPDRWHRISLKRVGTVARLPFKAHPSTFDRAIVYPYQQQADKWHSLRMSLRSIDKHFEDRDCQIIILGTARPYWLTNSKHRVKFIECWGYADALTRGCQMADTVMWMNDDILLLKDTGWDDLRTPLHFGPVTKELRLDLISRPNPWRDGYLKALDLLAAEGITEPLNYSTHTPYLYRRDLAQATMEKFGVWNKIPFELAYGNFHRLGGEQCNGHRVQSVAFGDARYLNHTDLLLTEDLKAAILETFPKYAKWEVTAPLDQ